MTVKTLDDILKFKIEELGKTEIPEWIDKIEKEYDIALELTDYELTPAEHDIYAIKFARIHDWFTIQVARASYYKAEVEGKLEKILRENKRNAPPSFTSEASRVRWVEENVPDYGKIKDEMSQAIGYYEYFSGKIESIKIKHYLCKNLGKSEKSGFNIGSHT